MENVARMGAKRNAYKILFRKLDRRTLGRRRRMRTNVINIDI